MQRHHIPKRRKKKHACYADRERSLKSAGFDSYAEYLDSKVWETVRQMAFEKHGKKCVRCGKTATAVHHAFYTIDVLLGVELDALHPVCTPCHEQAEWISKGEKATLKQANERLGIAGRMRQVNRRIKSRMKELRPWKFCPSCRKKKIDKSEIECRKCSRKPTTNPELQKLRAQQAEKKQLDKEQRRKKREEAIDERNKQIEGELSHAIKSNNAPWISVTRYTSNQYKFHDSRLSGSGIIATFHVACGKNRELTGVGKLKIVGSKRKWQNIKPEQAIAIIKQEKIRNPVI